MRRKIIDDFSLLYLNDLLGIKLIFLRSASNIVEIEEYDKVVIL